MSSTLRILSTSIVSSTNIDVSFTENLTPNLVPGNVSIVSQTNNAPNPSVTAITVNSNILSITCQPMTPYAAYSLTFQSTTTNAFTSVNGDQVIGTDGVSNQVLILGPIAPDNIVYNYLQSFYNGNIYNTNDYTTIVNSYIQSIANNFAEALYDIRQSKNENYLSFTVIDELHTRGSGPYDRLYEEAAYEVFRVGLSPTNTISNTSIVLSNFPSYPITLQRQLVTETIKPSSDNTNGTFNVNTLTFNLSNNPVTKVNSIVFNLTTTNPTYIYNIETLGYQLLNSLFDQDYASTYLLLANNQVKLNGVILTDPNFSIDQILNITIQYEYQGLGINVDPNSVDVYTNLQSIREVIPPLENIFTLDHAPITDNSNNIPTIGGVIFTNPNTTIGTPHPAFITEIPFSLSAPPSSPGVYSINYNNGNVYVFGSDSTNNGTGAFPPLATYYYRFTYTSEIDYVYDSNSLELVALPLGNLINNNGTINFNYEQVMVPGIDYNADCHIESINEVVGNNLSALNSITTQNSPITNIFQIFNQSTGEFYLLDRWNNNQVYFKFNNPPKIVQQVGENANFTIVPNELLGINSTTTNSNNLRVFTIYLANNTIINNTQDGIGSSFNSSLILNDGNVFISELWYYSTLNSADNINRLSFIGEYTVDYTNGIIYVAVSNTQDSNIGSATYKMDAITTQHPNIISVDDIYYRISLLNPINKHFSYINFTNNTIVPENLDISDEVFLNNSPSAPYQLFNKTVGAFIQATFAPGVTYAVKSIRSVYEYNDLLNNINPINFAEVSTSNNFTITVNSINKQTFDNVQFDGYHYYVLLNENIPYLSSGITYNFNIIRTSDNKQLWDSNGQIVPGNPLKLILSGINNPQINDFVNITYSFTINNLSRVVVNYNKGNFYINYTYVADTILISYEYGDNVIDFRQNTNLAPGQTYYVSYKVGALRDALLKNFATLVNVSSLNNFDLSLDRERYREALQAALSSFIQGPTITAVKNLVQIITHIEPQVIESAFSTWSLGTNLLEPEGISSIGNFQLLPAKYGNGVLINQPNQTITIPVSSNLRLEEGTFENWILPQWNGLDNDADLTFKIFKNNNYIAPYNIFIGAAEYHPTLNFDGYFSLNKNANVSGIPNFNKDGVFIYYAPDFSNLFNRWYIRIVDGYVNKVINNYQFQILSNGKFYDTKSINYIKPPNMTIMSSSNKINFSIKPNSMGINEGITFVSDLEHYILDFGKTHDQSRLSIYKDVSGYLNFRVYDKNKQMYIVSADVSSWQNNTPHMVAASWKLNTINNRDEMHLFIDGLEVPNIIKYGQKNQPYFHEKFRTISIEEITGLSNADIIGSNDLKTTFGSPIVSSSINFSVFNIFVGNTIYINEIGFNSNGYIIENINGQTLTLNANMPLSLTSNGRFSINQTSYTVNSDINVAPNTTVSTIHVFTSGHDLSTTTNNMVNSASINFSNIGVKSGYLLRIDNSDIEDLYTILKVNNNSLTLDGYLTAGQSNLTFQVYSNIENELPGVRALNPDYSISTSHDGYFNNILTISNGVLENDLILVRTLGLNSRNVKNKYYVWSPQNINILKTQLPAPINLDEVDIYRIILPPTVIGNNNSTLVGGEFISNNLPGAQPSNSQIGRTIQATISGTNVNFATPVTVTINGVTNSFITTSETISFTDYGSQNFVNLFISINYIQVNAKPTNPNRNALSIEVRETYSMTYSELSGLVPVVRYSYPITMGKNLFTNDGYTLTDGYGVFSSLDINNYLVIQSPVTVAGFYKINSVSLDQHSITVTPTNAAFTLPLNIFSNGNYIVLNATEYRSGLQNGFFTFESKDLPGQAYFLDTGYYELDYSTYATIKFDPLNNINMFIGSDYNGKNQTNAVLNQVIISSIMLSDTRIGEIISNNQGSVTKDYNSLIAPTSNINTLVLASFNNYPFTNNANFYANIDNNQRHFYSDYTVNDNFGDSLVILDTPLLLSNNGILDTRKQASIEFWMSPIFDTANDPNTRYYFDAYGAIVEEAVSVNDVSLKLSTPVSQVISVVLANGDPTIDYFAGGKIEIDTQKAIQEDVNSIGTTKAIVSQSILQIISVIIVGDYTQTDYFANGSIGSDGKTIFLGKTLPESNLPLIITYQSTANDNTMLNSQVILLNRRLPAQNTAVIVSYIPAGLQGDRISIFKDLHGWMNFSIIASGTNFTVKAPTRWTKNTWHRIKACYSVNGGMGNDKMQLFLDGYQYSNVLFEDTVKYHKNPRIFETITVGDGYYSILSSINFKDPINNLFIGTDYRKANPIFALINNLKISNILRPIYAPFGEILDVSYSKNLNTVLPVESDLYTTYLLNSVDNVELINDFATLINRATGGNEFTVNIFDSFDIVSSSTQVKTILESLLNTLTPGTSKIYIKYVS